MMMNVSRIAVSPIRVELPVPACRACPTVLVAALGVTLVALAGCQHQDRAHDALDARVARFDSTGDAAIRNEAIRPAKLQAALDFAQSRLRRDVARFPVTLQNAGELLREDFERFERNQPVYRAEIEDVLRGHPERIELNAICMFL